MKKRLFGLIAIPLIVIGSLTYANDFIIPDTENGTITVYSQDKSYGITIQDKNLGATNVGDYGYYFQWGNNHGNPAGTNTGTLNELLEANVTERVNKGYSGKNDKFIAVNYYNKKFFDTLDYRSGVYYNSETDNSYVGNSPYNNLWGGGNDNQTGNVTIVKGYDTVNHVVTNPDNRQGPCPDGYHVPSAGEWQELMMLWCNANSNICSGSVINTQNEELAWSNYLSGNGIGTVFSKDLKLPFADSRDYFKAPFLNVGNYWSSSPRGGSSPERAWALNFFSDLVIPDNYPGRVNGLPLRCFKNSFTSRGTKIKTKPSGGSSDGDSGSNKNSDDEKDVINNPSITNMTAPLESGAQGVSDDSSPLSRRDITSADRSSTQTFTQEFQEAYEFAYKNGITTINDIDKTKLNSPLTRIAMAKMLSKYAINVLGKKPNNSNIPIFSDVSNKLNEDYDGAVTLAYQLGIMGINMKDNKFRPYDTVTRAEFGTALSRMLYSVPDGSPYYATHLDKLKREGIISNTQSKLQEKRGYVMLMLMRSVK